NAAAEKEQQPRPPLRIGAVEREVEAEAAAIKRDRALGIWAAHDDMVDRRDHLRCCWRGSVVGASRLDQCNRYAMRGRNRDRCHRPPDGSPLAAQAPARGGFAAKPGPAELAQCGGHVVAPEADALQAGTACIGAGDFEGDVVELEAIECAAVDA